MRYHVKKLEEIKKDGCWSSLLIGVFQDDKQIGSYTRNYPSCGEETFAPFKKGDDWFALYSSDYTCIKIMKLPECIEIGGEESSAFGFCPVEIFVPQYQIDFLPGETGESLLKYPKENHKWISRDREEKVYDTECFEPEKEIFYENFAFVSGCIWGDDTSWKIEMRDISEAHKGIIKKVSNWGYYELSEKLSLKESVKLDGFFKYVGEDEESINVKVTLTKTIRLNKNKDEINLEFFD